MSDPLMPGRVDVRGGAVTAPNPQRREPYHEHEAPDDQRLYCARRDLCLDVAADRGWPALTCARCIAYEPMELAQIQADVAPLVSILCETIKPIPVQGYRRVRR